MLKIDAPQGDGSYPRALRNWGYNFSAYCTLECTILWNAKVLQCVLLGKTIDYN